MRIILLLLMPAFGFSQIKLEKLSFLGDKVEILCPSNLKEMSDETWKLKYHDFPRPILALSDDKGEVNFLADMTKNAGTEDQLTSYKDLRKERLKKNYPETKFLSDGVKTVNGKKVGYLKFISTATDQKVFNYYFFTIEDGKILFFTFNCIDSLRSKWEKKADEMVSSLKTK